ncbi:hypothetical protein ONZ43_g2811 [Nemania bipapillata]|uniref:Uncharacterized protein n=1 Tax=Nemania bipapillata TaxID=110536 RepID=A0ACC2IZI9_9PEZI|nr:hypothetical protein ONZ43_g2811 [Nemania bipapillata]
MQFTNFFLAALSLGSAIAGPVAGFKPFDDATAAVAHAKTIVQEQVVVINALTKGTPTDETVTKIQQSLVTVGANVNGLHAYVLALGQFGSTPLSQAQLAKVPQFAEDFRGIFINVEVIGKKLTGAGFSHDVVAQIKPELQWVLSTSGPIARPIIVFARIAAPIHIKLFTSVTSVLVNIQALVTVIIAPLAGLKLVVA